MSALLDFMAAHDETEICVVQNDDADPFAYDRLMFLGVTAFPTIVSGGVTDVWPLGCIDQDYQEKAGIPSPMTIDITENDVGDFTVHLTAEEDITGAAFFMAVTLDEEVPGSDGPAHLPHHVKLHLTPPSSGDPFSLMEGESVDINHSFPLDPDWDYGKVGVAAWVSRPGGDPSSPACNLGFNLTENEVLQSRWVRATIVTGVDGAAPGALAIAGAYPNPFNPKTTIRFNAPGPMQVRLTIHDFLGRQVAELVDRGVGAGEHAVAWDGTSDAGERVASGVYFARLEGGAVVDARKLVLMK